MVPRLLKNLCTSGRRVHRKGFKISSKERDLWDFQNKIVPPGTEQHQEQARKEIGDWSFINLHTTKLLEEEEEALKEGKNIKLTTEIG